MTLSVQVTSNYLKRKSALRPADCLIRRNSGRFQSPFGSGLVIIATLLETAVGKKQQCLPLTNPARAGIVFFWKRFYTAGLGHAKAHFGGQGGAAVMKTVVWNVNGFAPASAKAFAHPRQVQSRHFLLSGNQDPVSAFRSRASLVLEPGQTPGGRGRT